MRLHVRWSVLPSAALSLVAACATETPSGDAAGELMATDRAFVAETAARGAEGWASYFTDDGRMYQRVGVLVGRDAIRTAMEPAFTPGTTELRWEPDTAIAAASGELGYTRGRWQYVSLADDSVIGSGRYVSIWHRQPDGTWKVALDIGNDDPPS